MFLVSKKMFQFMYMPGQKCTDFIFKKCVLQTNDHIHRSGFPSTILPKQGWYLTFIQIHSSPVDSHNHLIIFLVFLWIIQVKHTPQKLVHGTGRIIIFLYSLGAKNNLNIKSSQRKHFTVHSQMETHCYVFMEILNSLRLENVQM